MNWYWKIVLGHTGKTARNSRLCHKMRGSATQSKDRDDQMVDQMTRLNMKACPERTFLLFLPIHSPIFCSLLSSLSFFQEIWIKCFSHNAAKERIRERKENQRRDVIYINFRFYFFLNTRSHCSLHWHSLHGLWWCQSLDELSASAYQGLHLQEFTSMPCFNFRHSWRWRRNSWKKKTTIKSVIFLA